MKSTTTTTKKPSPLYVTGIEIEEKENIEAFAEAIGRPVSWVVRDACRCYITALEDDVAALREKLNSPPIELATAGHTPTTTRGRPSMSDKRH
jgi:predicted DNA-binding protein